MTVKYVSIVSVECSMSFFYKEIGDALVETFRAIARNLRDQAKVCYSTLLRCGR